MRSQRLRKYAAGFGVLVAVATAGLFTTATATAEPLWPGGPDFGTPAVIPPPPAPCDAPGARACLRLSTNEAWLMDNGRTVFGPTPISHGQPGYETNVGVFDVDFKKPYHWSTMHHADMYYAIFFDGDIAFHVGPVDLKSHGCIRMTEPGAKAFYEHLNPGDIVQVIR
ncbi:L,D-transpeptidase [Antrihabitans sp. YC3-6]|uniref:L,D-transpeptidase n=1 Tax=Antrihabitans stalagmiti TaxID=2799499 RepID=A0A934NMR6_9NOCA|nr:L,D-transpeptidase [Antrihabitans stalagmiti]MBJ8338030.1 L,D-transpeptidase [Antrihabitans stalagmiti]